MADQVNVYEAKTQLSKLLERVEAGEEIVIARNGRPVARLVPSPREPEPTPRRLGGYEDKIFFTGHWSDGDEEIADLIYGSTEADGSGVVRLLLDTQALIWSVGNSSLLATPTARALEDPGNTVIVSVVTLWEAVIKRGHGKLVLGEDLAFAARERDFGILPIQEEHARAVADLPLHHRDPFDRMLVAQARHEGLTLVTADRRLEAYSVAVLRADA